MGEVEALAVVLDIECLQSLKCLQMFSCKHVGTNGMQMNTQAWTWWHKRGRLTTIPCLACQCHSRDGPWRSQEWHKTCRTLIGSLSIASKWTPTHACSQFGKEETSCAHETPGGHESKKLNAFVRRWSWGLVQCPFKTRKEACPRPPCMPSCACSCTSASARRLGWRARPQTKPPLRCRTPLLSYIFIVVRFDIPPVVVIVWSPGIKCVVLKLLIFHRGVLKYLCRFAVLIL